MITNVPKKYLDFITENPALSSAEIAEHFNHEKAPRTIRHYSQAIEAGLAIPRISSAFGAWQDTKSLHEFRISDFIEQSRLAQAERELDDPVFMYDRWQFDTNKPIVILFLSCMHLGGRFTNYNEFDNVYRTLLDDKRIYIASLGDDIEGYLDSFPDKDAVWQQLSSPKLQRAALENILLPFKGRILCGCGSQHGSKWVLTRQGYDPVKEMYLETFNTPFYDGMAYVELRVGSCSYHIALSHEFKGTSVHNPLHAQNRALKESFPSADVIIMGDKHTPAAQWFPAYAIEYDMGLRQSPYALLLQAGTAKTGLDKYTIQGWSRGMFGWPFVVFYPNEHKIKWTFYYEDLDAWLN